MIFKLFLLSVFPNLLLLWYVYSKDKVDKEPFYLLILLFLGGIISCFVSILIESYLKKYIPFLLIDYSNLNFIQIIFKILFTVALLEEGTKWLINYLLVWKNKNFNYLYDSILYSVFISLGFATVENIIYGILFNSSGYIPIIMRGFISIPIHCVFGVFMGYYLGLSKKEINCNYKQKYRKYIFYSILIPIFLHFIYDILLTYTNLITYIILILFILTLYYLSFLIIKDTSVLRKKL